MSNRPYGVTSESSLSWRTPPPPKVAHDDVGSLMESCLCWRGGPPLAGRPPPPHVTDGWGVRPLRWLSVLVLRLVLYSLCDFNIPLTREIQCTVEQWRFSLPKRQQLHAQHGAQVNLLRACTQAFPAQLLQFGTKVLIVVTSFINQDWI